MPGTLTVGKNPFEVAFDRANISTNNSGDNTVTELRSGTSQASGLNFAPVVTYGSCGAYAQSVAVADVNGDGKPDMVVANSCISDSNCYNGGSLGVLPGNGDGTFQPVVTYNSVEPAAFSVALADVNGDGKPDMVVAIFCTSGNNCNGSVGVLLGL